MITATSGAASGSTAPSSTAPGSTAHPVTAAGPSRARLGEALGTDFFAVREQFTDEQWARFTAARRFADEEVGPAAAGYWERAEIPWPLIRRLPDLGIVGEDIDGYGCPGMSAMACGLVTMELHRGDGSLGVTLGVHSGLAMRSIALCGSDEQKVR
jgi:glutaryl-CoA dehydrogenase